MAITTPDAVPGEIIEAAWGDAVRADLTALDNGKAALAGANFTGAVTSTASIRSGAQVVAGTATPSIGSSTPGFVALAAGPVVDVINNAAGTSPSITLSRQGAGAADIAQQFVRFSRTASDTTIGTITIATTSSVAYNTTSDPRLKHRDGDAGDAAELVQRLGAAVFRGRWLDEAGNPAGGEWIMLSSHDVEELFPFAVAGERDAVDEHGNVDPQQVNYPALVPALAAALAQALDRIDALEAKSP